MYHFYFNSFFHKNTPKAIPLRLPLILLQSEFPMAMWRCCLRWLWQDDSNSPSLEPFDPQASHLSLPLQVVAWVCLNSPLNTTVFLRPSFSLFQEPLSRSKIHYISNCLTREWDASFSFLKVLLLFGIDSLGVFLIDFGRRRKKQQHSPY